MVLSLLVTSLLASVMLAEELGALVPRREPHCLCSPAQALASLPGLRTGSSLPGLKELRRGPTRSEDRHAQHQTSWGSAPAMQTCPSPGRK